LVVTRHYRVNFRPNTKGYLIEGNGCRPMLMPRHVLPIWPLWKSQGDYHYFSDPTGPCRHDHVSRKSPTPALNESEAQAARQLIDGAALKPDAQHQAIEFLDQVAKQTGPVISHWPASLFRPGLSIPRFSVNSRQRTAKAEWPSSAFPPNPPSRAA
jgi:hypothetical protein